MSTMEARLIKKAKAGNVSAFERLIRQHQLRVYNICLRTLGNTRDAEDAAQEALLKAWRAIGSFREDSTFSTWIYRIAVNCSYDLIRKNKGSISLDEITEEGYQLPSDQTAFDERILTADCLKNAMMHLSDEHRVILSLSDIQGFSYQEISEILSLAQGTVRSRLNRARNRLRNILRDMELYDGSAVLSMKGGSLK